jgi:hypothetical protein
MHRTIKNDHVELAIHLSRFSRTAIKDETLIGAYTHTGAFRNKYAHSSKDPAFPNYFLLVNVQIQAGDVIQTKREVKKMLAHFSNGLSGRCRKNMVRAKRILRAGQTRLWKRLTAETGFSAWQAGRWPSASGRMSS